MQITANMVKELRERTSAGMMDCKKALVETNGDLDAAAEHLRKVGIAKADKKSGRVAAEGAVLVEVSADNKRAVLLEINSETDFVAKDASFQEFAQGVVKVLMQESPADLAALLELTYAPGVTVEQARQALVAKIGENVQVRRFDIYHVQGGQLGAYAHGSRIGVLVDLKGGSESLAKDIAMHVAASKPICIDESQVPGEVIAKEREIQTAQAAESGKPADIVAKMVDGRIKKYLAEVTLLGQPFVKDPDQSVAKLLAAAGAEAVYFSRFEVGEGIEKKVENFAEEVMAQVKGA